MEHGPSAEVIIRDDSGDVYGPGTGSYAWAFEVSLWHHARAGNVAAACDNEAQEDLWAEFIGQKDRPSLPSPDKDHPLWDVPFRLVAGRNASGVRHVGRVS